MRREVKEIIEALLYRKIENSELFESAPIVFKCRILSNEQQSYTNVGGLHYRNKGLTIYSTKLYTASPGDAVEINGQRYIVTGVSYDLESLDRLTSSRFSLAYKKIKCPKVLTLV